MAFSLRDYEILGEIGQGGFGTILKARKKNIGKLVAIKQLSLQRTQAPKEILRFRREAEAMAVLTHDNIISILDYACLGNNYYIVMEYIEGLDFDIALKRKIPTNQSLLIIEKTIRALKVAHAEKIIHRDIKPGNILLGKQGQIKLADFGLATCHQDMTQRSTTSATIGTFGYMAPEALVNPRDVDNRIDIYSLGCVLYRIVSGNIPFDGDTIGALSYQILNKEPASLFLESHLNDLGNIIISSLNKDREKRPTLQELHMAVRNVIDKDYHSIEDDLKEFIIKGNIKDTKINKNYAGTTMKNIPIRKNIWKKNIYAPVSVIVLLLLVIIGIFSISLYRADTDVPHISMPSPQSSVSGSKIIKREKRQLLKEAPKPLTETTGQHTTGTLVLNGLSMKDRVKINGKIIRRKIKAGTIDMALDPGVYHVEILGDSMKSLEREIRITPYQVFTININNERSDHGGK